MSENKPTPEYAYFLKNLVTEYAQGVNKNLWALAKTLKEIRDSKAYKLLDCPTFNEFIAQPEIGLKRSAVYALIKRFEVYSFHLQIPEERLLAIDHSKLDIIAPVVERDKEEWLARAENLSARDLINEVRKEQGREEMPIPTTPPGDSLKLATPAPSSYPNYVRGRPCCECGSTPSMFAHFPRTERTGGVFGIPLCAKCHNLFHIDPQRWAWEQRWAWAKYLEGLIAEMFKEKPDVQSL